MNSALDELVSEIEDHYSIAESYDLCTRYMIDCLELVHQSLPSPVASCFDTVKTYWMGNSADLVELNESRVKCWKYLDDLENSPSPSPKSIHAVRALICPLFPEPKTEDIHELLYWFVSQVRAVADVDDSLVDITKRHFPKAAEPQSE